MEIIKATEVTASRQKTGKEGGNFSGEVFMEELVTKPTGAPVRMLRVFFTPAARTFWHIHPEGQVLHVIAGNGGVQKEGEPVQRIGPGDTVYAAPGEKHWHGAAPNGFLIHLAISPNFGGKGTQWRFPDNTSGTTQEVNEDDYQNGFNR